MRLSNVLCSFLALACLASASPIELTSRQQTGISQSTFDDLVRYTRYSSAVYEDTCPSPVGSALVRTFNVVHTQGLVARDDVRKEIVVVFRGSKGAGDAITNAQLIMKPFSSPGVSNPNNAWVHSGFLDAFNVASSVVRTTVAAELSKNPGYSLIVTGHSLGGALASFGALSLKAAHPTVPLKLYTFGQPRVGNAAYASLVEERIGVNNIFRGVNQNDGVPTILGKWVGYRHFATEYWQFADVASPANVKICSGGDDPTCSASIPSAFINAAHDIYFGEVLADSVKFCNM